MTLESLELPVQEHSNAFWSNPTMVPRLAVLVLNASHGSWRVAKKGAMGLHSSELFWNLWRHASLRVCADGGANRLYDRSVELQVQDVVIPHYIKGDLDSLRDDVREFFAAKGTTVMKDFDQSTNDLDKCLQLIDQVQTEHDKDGHRPDKDGLRPNKDGHRDRRVTVVIFGAMGGRFDQEMQNINALFRWRDKFQEMVLVSDETTARLLLPGARHVIYPNFHFETRTCGLIPIAGTCKETRTSGLKWNLRAGMETCFGGLISSSNHVEESSDQVEIVSSHPLIWTTERKK